MNTVFAVRFIVESGGRPVGLVVAYEHFPEHGFAKVGTMLQEENVGHGGGVVATVLLIDYLFRTLPLRKVYLESYGFNLGVVGMMRKLGLPEEGCLKDSFYWDGAYWDLHIFAVYRAAWPGIRARLFRGSIATPETVWPLPAATEPQQLRPAHTSQPARGAVKVFRDKLTIPGRAVWRASTWEVGGPGSF
jgi:hypothetical protein